MDDQFIGRAEREAKIILEGILSVCSTMVQVPLERLIMRSDYDSLDKETQQHKFDIVVIRPCDVLVIEINYKHGEKASKKWNNIFVPYLQASKAFQNKKLIPVAINDYECTSLFKHERNSGKPIRITDVIDVCNALYAAGVKTCL